MLYSCTTHMTTVGAKGLNYVTDDFSVQLQLDELRKLVRSPLTKIGRQILSALIVIEVHARDVVTNMVAQEVCNVNDFEWISQLRSVVVLSVSHTSSCFVVSQVTP